MLAVVKVKFSGLQGYHIRVAPMTRFVLTAQSSFPSVALDNNAMGIKSGESQVPTFCC